MSGSITVNSVHINKITGGGVATSNYVTNAISGLASSNYVTNAIARTAITTSGGSITSNLNIVYTPVTPTGFAALTITSSNTNSGGYADLLKVTNSSAGATFPNKSFRLTNGGILEIINSAYSASLMSLTDTGDFSVNGKIPCSASRFVIVSSSSSI